jgi:arsenate reductase-like glutaredoxin family protein
MISLATDPKQIILIYNSDQKSHREIYAYAEAADKNLLAIDISKEKVAGTTWTEIADSLGLRVRDLLHTDHSRYIETYGKNHDIDCDGAIKTLQKDPNMLIFPIAVQGSKGLEVKLYNEMLKFFDVDTAAIKIP